MNKLQEIVRVALVLLLLAQVSSAALAESSFRELKRTLRQEEFQLETEHRQEKHSVGEVDVRRVERRQEREVRYQRALHQRQERRTQALEHSQRSSRTSRNQNYQRHRSRLERAAQRLANKRT